jgi:hypothetical protein
MLIFSPHASLLRNGVALIIKRLNGLPPKVIEACGVEVKRDRDGRVTEEVLDHFRALIAGEQCRSEGVA